MPIQKLLPTFVMFLGTDILVKRAFSNIILLWNLDNSDRMDNEQETSTSVVSIYPYGHIISFGVGFAYYIRFGSPEPHSNNKQKFPRILC